jgi:hypothetical protein
MTPSSERLSIFIIQNLATLSLASRFLKTPVIMPAITFFPVVTLTHRRKLGAFPLIACDPGSL